MPSRTTSHGLFHGMAPLLLVLLALLPLPLAAEQVDLAAEAGLGDLTDEDRSDMAYYFGYQIGQNLRGRGLYDLLDEIRLPRARLLKGLLDSIDNLDAEIDQERMQQSMDSMRTLQQALAVRRRAERDRDIAARQQAADEWLASNAKAEGVKVTDSGLQYLQLKKGQGKPPGPFDTVVVHYEGRLTDGTQFDSSIERGEPAEFALNRVIAGWTEGLQLMAPGSKYRLFVPPQLGYGPGGAGSQIPPNAVLVFEVELLEVKAADS